MKFFKLFIILFLSPVYSAESQPTSNGVKLHFFGIERADWVSESITNKIQDYFKAIIEINSFISIIDAVEVSEEKKKHEVGKSMEPEIAKAYEILWKGKELLNKKKINEAIDNFMKARNILKDNLSKLEDFEIYIDSLFQLTNAFFVAGYDDNGYETLAKLLSLRPDLTIDKKKHEKSFVTAIERQKEKMNKITMGDVSIKANLSDANIYVDGVLKGSGEVIIKNLPRGRHFLKVKKDGYKQYNEFFVTPLPGKTLHLIIMLEEEVGEKKIISEKRPLKPGLGRFLQSGDFGKEFIKEAWQFGKKINADYILFGYVSKSSSSYHFALFLFSIDRREIVSFDPAVLEMDLSNLQIVLLDQEQKVVEALKNFPSNRIIYTTPPIYAIELKEAKEVPEVKIEEKKTSLEVKEHKLIEKEEAKIPPKDKELLEKKKEVGTISVGFEEIPQDFPLVKETQKWYKKWWVWSIVGGAVMVGGITIISYKLSSGGSSDNFKAKISW